MTEPLLMALTLLAVALLIAVVRRRRFTDRSPQRRTAPSRLRSFALACMTRYEAWPVTVSALAPPSGRAGAAATRSDGASRACRAIARLSRRSPSSRSSIFSRIVIGEWFVDGFSCRRTRAGPSVRGARGNRWGVRTLSGTADSSHRRGRRGVAGDRRAQHAARLGCVLPLALARHRRGALARVLDGHPTASATWCRSSPRRRSAPARGRDCRNAARRWPSLALVLRRRSSSCGRSMRRRRWWSRRSGIGPNIAARAARQPTAWRANYDGETIMASMGSLGHYMQELSRAAASRSATSCTKATATSG